jgi:SAM-dependent methyltransferase
MRRCENRRVDDVGGYLQRRWEALGRAGALYCRPLVDRTPESARRLVDPDRALGDLTGRDVLCLAGGGGTQSAAFGLLGARVTVLDLDEGQLERDREAAVELGLDVRTEHGEMRDLSRFAEGAFDLVWHPYSVNFVPELDAVVAGVARVLRSGGIYVVMMANPFAAGIGTKDWNGHGYVLRLPYVDGAEYEFEDEEWVGADPDVPPPREFRHTLGKVVGSISAAGLVLFRLDEETARPSAGPPGSWEHLKSVIPPWLSLWARKSPGSI